MGGTGKTPVVVALAEFFKNQGYTVGVVSRGYGARRTQRQALIVQEHTPVTLAGDEPALIYRRTLCPVCVSRDRPAAARTLLEYRECDVLISDDGLQHYALQRDYEILVVDARRGYGNGFCLPAGPLREGIKRVEEADYLLVNSDTEATADNNSFTVKAQQFISLDGLQRVNLDAFRGKSVHAIAGTASAERFFDSLRLLGLHVSSHRFPDHHPFVQSEFEGLGDLPLIMTEKDAVKCFDFGLKNAWYLQVTAELPTSLCNSVLALLEKLTLHRNTEKR